MNANGYIGLQKCPFQLEKDARELTVAPCPFANLALPLRSHKEDFMILVMRKPALSKKNKDAPQLVHLLGKHEEFYNRQNNR